MKIENKLFNLEVISMNYDGVAKYLSEKILRLDVSNVL
jgi:hypothetical protein